MHVLRSTWEFDAVVVASGHYNMPKIPDFSGLKEWKALRPNQVWHSKTYRDPKQLQGKNILLIGAGVSSNDIAKESAPYANKIFQSARDGTLDLPASMLPSNATRVAAIKGFQLNDDNQSRDTDALPGTIHLQDGTELDNIHVVILCTGYITSYPFLSAFHDDNIAASEADENVLVTRDGEMVHNLHKDIFYIQDPSLMFVGCPYHIATFSLFDFQAQVVARVLASKASLPPQQAMRDEYCDRVRRHGLGRDFHSLRAEGDEQAYVADLVNWMNRDAVERGSEDKMLGHTAEWHQADRDRAEKLSWLRATKDKVVKIAPEGFAIRA
jgi:cation diffusion facilitator CzcD-associated flavoprotein CzcO